MDRFGFDEKLEDIWKASDALNRLLCLKTSCQYKEFKIEKREG